MTRTDTELRTVPMIDTSSPTKCAECQATIYIREGRSGKQLAYDAPAPCQACGVSRGRPPAPGCNRCQGTGQMQAINPIARKSLARAKKRQAKCRHRHTTKMPDNYTGGLGFHVERCEDCGLELRTEVA